MDPARIVLEVILLIKTQAVHNVFKIVMYVLAPQHVLSAYQDISLLKRDIVKFVHLTAITVQEKQVAKLVK